MEDSSQHNNLCFDHLTEGSIEIWDDREQKV